MTDQDPRENDNNNIEIDNDETQDFDGFLHRGETNMTIGTNGIMIEGTDSHVYLVFNPSTKRVEIKSDKNAPKVSLKVEGDLYAAGERESVHSKLKTLEHDLMMMQIKNAELESRLEEVYHAPGMPGFVKAMVEWNDLVYKPDASTSKSA